MSEEIETKRKLVKLSDKDDIAIQLICTIGGWMLSVAVKNLYRKAIIEPRSTGITVD